MPFQDGHHDSVAKPLTGELNLPEDTFFPEAALLIEPYRYVVICISDEPDSIEVKIAETMPHKRPDGVLSETTTP